MTRKFHIEVDERRRAGDIKGALDLARYAHGELSNHQLLKRSYAWALYSYLKLADIGPSRWPENLAQTFSRWHRSA